MLRRVRPDRPAGPAGVPKLPVVDLDLQTLLVKLFPPAMLPWVSLDSTGIDHVPPEGPAIVVANHRSYLDPIILTLALAPRRLPVRMLAKRELFDAPLVGSVMQGMGAVRVDRRARSGQPLREAAAALRAGDVVVIMPQGTIPRGRSFFRPELTGRTGAARLAALTGAPVVPFGLWGTEHVWPRSARLPRLWKVFHPPPVIVRGGPPVELALRSPESDTERIMAAISEQLPPSAARAHGPSPSELARTYPPAPLLTGVRSPVRRRSGRRVHRSARSIDDVN